MQKKAIVLFASLSLILGCVYFAQAQYRPRVRVYNSRTYNNTRTVMNRRAARKKTIKKRTKAIKKRRQTLRQKSK